MKGSSGGRVSGGMLDGSSSEQRGRRVAWIVSDSSQHFVVHVELRELCVKFNVFDIVCVINVYKNMSI